MITENISFLLVDDHDLVLSGMKNLISKEFPQASIVTSKSAEDATIKLSQAQWTYVISDVSLPGKSGIELVSIVRERQPSSKMIIVTQHTEIWIIKKLIEVNPDAIVLKMNDQNDILKAIYSVYEGKNFFSETVYRLMVEILQKNKSNEETPELTNREKEILKLIASGLTSGQIADKLFISEKTVEAHRKNLFVKFDANNSASLIHKAMKEGYL